MDDIWSILGLESTQDVSAIRRAYAQKTKQCHPEEDPEGFMRLREAYQRALTWAEGEAAEPSMETRPLHQKTGNSRPENGESEDFEEEPEEPGWSLPEEELEVGPNPFADSEAIRQFLELYTGKQRKNSKLWMDYFTSGVFLDAAWEPQFATLLMEKVSEMEENLPPNREFLTWLYVVYGFEMTEEAIQNQASARRVRRVNLPPETQFYGIDAILHVASKGPVVKRLRGNEFAIAQSFQEYRRLRRLAQSGVWNAQAMAEFGYMVGRYSSVYIKDRCEQQAKPDLERHPAGLRVFTHFFESHELPEEIYRVLWQKLGLKSALMGRSKVLYGRLREIVVERVPGIDEEEVENFLALNRAHDIYRAQIKAQPEREDEESAAFFARPDLQKAMRSRRFVEEQLLTYTNWRREGMGEGLLRRMQDFYRINPDIPCAREAEAALGKDLMERVIRRRNQEDAQAEMAVSYERLTLAYRPFFRHWLNTAWFDGGKSLADYLDKRLPYQAEWGHRLLQKEGGTIQPRTVAVSYGTVEVGFHLRYMEFRVNGRPVHRPCLPWEKTVNEGGDGFFYLLPITTAAYDQYDEVCREILRRLPATAAPEEDRELIAEGLATAVCCLPLDGNTGEAAAPEEVLPMKLYAEDGERLYGCVWIEENQIVTLFEQTATGRRVRRRYELAPNEDAMEVAQRLLKEAISPDRFDLSLLKELPWHIYFTPNDGPEQTLTRFDLKPNGEDEGPERTGGEFFEELYEDDEPPEETQPREPAEDEVTEKAIAELIVQFGKGTLRRLELDWFEGSLVLIKEAAGYACFYFEGPLYYDMWYSMLSKPEVYQTVESEDVVYVPFGMGKLPDYVVHDSPASILRDLDRVFWQLAQGRPQSQGAGGWLWDSNVSRMDGQHKLYMAQQKLGGFPPNRGQNRLAAKFVISKYPVELEHVNLDGERTLTEIKSGSYGQASTALTVFMQEKLAKLRLSWEFKMPWGEVFRRHLILLRDDGRFMMAWLQDDKDWAQYYLAETDGEECGKDTFLNRPVPARLVHLDLKRIRNCVDLILDDMDNTDPVTERPEEFETVKEPYEAVWAELIGQEE